MTRTAATIVALTFATFVMIAWHFIGIPAAADGRLASEQWRVLAVAPLLDDIFLVSVHYSNNDIRSYLLRIDDPGERDKFLQASQGLRKGRSLVGKAQHGRAGLQNDSGMDFSFNDAPETEPKVVP